MSKQTDWEEYERRKAAIQRQNLSSDEYEKAISALMDELDCEVESE